MNKTPLKGNTDINKITTADRSGVTKFTLSMSFHDRVATTKMIINANVTSSRAREKNTDNNDRFVEPTTSGFGPCWPVKLKIEILMPALLNRGSGVNVSLKMHTRRVHKFMTFVNEGATTMPVGLAAAYKNLTYNLNNLHSELKSSNEYKNDTVTHFCELILHLIDETSSIYRHIKKIT